jgi:hypothetical protein
MDEHSDDIRRPSPRIEVYAGAGRKRWPDDLKAQIAAKAWSRARLSQMSPAAMAAGPSRCMTGGVERVWASWCCLLRRISGRQIVGVCAIDVLMSKGKVAAVRAGGRVGGPAGMLESFDEGRTFHVRDMSSVTGMILDIHFIDEQTGFIAGASEAEEDKAHAKILKTTDSGKTWRAVFETDRAGDNNWKLAFPSAQIGYATIISYQAPDDEARGYVVKTEDGGEHWQRQTVTRDREWVPYGINFIDERRGWVGGSTGGFETTDGGASWTPSGMGMSVNKIRFVKRPDGVKTAFAIGRDLYRLDLKQ